MRKIRLFVQMAVIFALVAGSALSFAQVAPPVEPSGKPVKLGYIMPITGSMAPDGKDMKIGAEIALKEVNAAGGVLGRPLELIFGDTESRPKAAIEVAHKLIDVNKVPMILGSYSSGNALPICEYTDETHTVYLNTCATSPELRKCGPWFFSMSLTSEFNSKLLVGIAIKDTGQKKFAILSTDNAYGKATGMWLKHFVEEAGGEVVSEVYYPRYKTDYRSELQKVYAANPPAVLYFAYAKESRILAKQAYELGYDTSKWYSANFADTVKAAIPETVDGMVGINAMSKGQRALSVTKQYKEITGGEAISQWVWYAYDTVWMAALAINFANSTEPDRIRRVLPHVGEIYRGASGGPSGDKSFDQDGMQRRGGFVSLKYDADKKSGVSYHQEWVEEIMSE